MTNQNDKRIMCTTNGLLSIILHSKLLSVYFEERDDGTCIASVGTAFALRHFALIFENTVCWFVPFLSAIAWSMLELFFFKLEGTICV